MPPLTSLLSRTLLFRELSILCCRTSRLLIPRADAVILIGTAPDKPVNIILRGAQTSGRSGRIETENPSGRGGRVVGVRYAALFLVCEHVRVLLPMEMVVFSRAYSAEAEPPDLTHTRKQEFA